MLQLLRNRCKKSQFPVPSDNPAITHRSSKYELVYRSMVNDIKE